MHTDLDQSFSDQELSEAKGDEPCQVLFRNLTTGYDWRGKTPRSALMVWTNHMTFLKKRSLGGQKFLFFFDTPGKRAAYNGGTVHLHIPGYDRKEPANFRFTFPSPRPGARASVGTLKTTPEQMAYLCKAVTALFRRRHLGYIVYTKFHFYRIGRREPRMEGCFWDQGGFHCPATSNCGELGDRVHQKYSVQCLKRTFRSQSHITDAQNLLTVCMSDVPKR